MGEFDEVGHIGGIHLLAGVLLNPGDDRLDMLPCHIGGELAGIQVLDGGPQVAFESLEEDFAGLFCSVSVGHVFFAFHAS